MQISDISMAGVNNKFAKTENWANTKNSNKIKLGHIDEWLEKQTKPIPTYGKGRQSIYKVKYSELAEKHGDLF